MKKNIVLIGMPGSGKSTIGVLLAKAINYHFIDGDLLIQRQEGKTLVDIINEKGIDAFLAIENQVLGDINTEASVIATGGSDSACVAVSALFQEALKRHAVQMIVLHNHPSGDPNPSTADIQLTERLAEGAKLLGLQLSDHIVIGDNRYYSFLENSIMPV